MNALRSRLPTFGAAANRLRVAWASTEPLLASAPTRTFWVGRACRRAPAAVHDHAVFVADPIFSPFWRPVSPFMRTVMESLQHDIKVLQQDFAADLNQLRRAADWKGNVFGLRARVAETESQIKLTADLPGVPRENIKVSVTSEGALEVTAVRTEGAAAGENASELKFKSVYQLPKEVDREAIKASVKDGVLEITLPKASAPEVAPKQVEVMGA